MKKKNNIYNILLVVFALIFVVSSFFLGKELIQRRQAAEYLTAIQSEYIPKIPVFLNTDSKHNNTGDSEDAPPIKAERVEPVNPTIHQLVEEYPDVIGWLTVEGANVNHPFVQADDNATYLWSDLNREYINGGTLFMDYFNERDFSDKLTIIYGHNMRNGTMFGQLANFLDFDYLLENPDVYISLPYSTEHYTIAACLVVDGADNVIYDRIGEKEDMQEVVDFIYANTQVNPDTPLDADSDILVLSTCNRTFDLARTLLICIPD